MTRERGWRLDALVLVGYFLALVVLFWPVVLGGKVLIPFDILYSDPPWRHFAASMGVSQPQNGLLGDLVYQDYVWKQFALESLRARQVPLWNPYLYSGTPFLASGLPSICYPLAAVYYLFSVASGYVLFALLQMWLAGALTYAYARVIRLNRFGAALAGLTWMLGTPMVANVVFPMIQAAMSWLPAILAVIEEVVRQAGWREPGSSSRRDGPEPGWLPTGRTLWMLVAGVLGVGLTFLAGHLEMSMYVAFVSAAYGAWRLAGLWWRTRDTRTLVRTFAWLAAMACLGVMLSGVQIVPFVEFTRSNFREGLTSYQQVVGWALPTRQVLTFMIPDFFGNPSHHRVFDIFSRTWVDAPAGSTAWGIKNYIEAASYVGVLPLLLALLGVRSWKRGTPLFFALLAVVSLLFAFGTPLDHLLYALPGFNQLHTAFRWLFLYSFATAILAGFGADALSRQPDPDRRTGDDQPASAGSRYRLMAPVLITLTGLAVLGLVGMSIVFPAPALTLVARTLRGVQAARAAFATASGFASYELRNVAVFGLLLAASGLVLLLRQREIRRATGGRRGLRAWQALALGLVAADLFLAGYGFNPAVDPKLAAFTPPSVAWLQRDSSPYRVTGFGSNKALWPNTAMLFGIQDIRGYISTILRAYVETIDQVEDQSSMLLYNRITSFDRVESLDAPLLNLLGVKYVLTTNRIDHPGYRLVYDAEIRIYQNERVLPRAFAVSEARRMPRQELLASLSTFDPARVVLLEDESGSNGPAAAQPGAQADNLLPTPAQASPGAQLVRISRYTPNEVQVDVTGASGWLVLADSYFEGWKAYAHLAGQPGERELPIERADGTFRAVELPQGTASVRFTYSPMSFKLGLYLSFMAVVCLALLAAYWLWNRLYGADSLDPELREGEVVHRVARNSMAPMLTSLANKAIDFAFAALMLRILGPTLAGRYYFAIVVVGYLDIFTNFGLNLLLIREVAKDRTQAARYLSNTVALRLILWLASLPVLGIFLVAWRGLGDMPNDTLMAILLLMLSLVPSNLAAALSSVFNAFERMEYPAGITTLTTLLKVGLGVLVLLAGWGFVGLAGVSIVANLVTVAVLGRLVVRHFFRPRIDVDPGFVRNMVSISYPLMLNHLLQTLFFKVDVTLLQPLKGDAVVGWYSTAYKWIDALLIIPAYFTMAIFPLMSRYAASSHDSLGRAYVLAARLLVMVALPIAVLTTFIADELILVLGGPDYLPHGAIALRIMIWFLPFSFLNGVTQYVLIALDEQRWITKTFAVAAAFNIGANLVLIPRYSYPAAAAVTIASELVLLVPWTRSATRHLGPLPWLAIARPAVAASGMAAVLWLLRPAPLGLGVTVASLVYVVLLVALGTFNAEDRALARRLLPAGRGKPAEAVGTRGNS